MRALAKSYKTHYSVVIMSRIFILVLCLMVLPLQLALAQEQLRMRSGEHEGYSRVVFDWNTRVPYTVTSSTKGKLMVSFEKGASLKTANIDDVSNILGLEVLSESPLKLSLDIPKDSRTRNFYAGDRLVIDIYDPPSGKPKSGKPKVMASKKKESKQQPKKEVKKEAKKKVAAAPKPKEPAPKTDKKPEEKTEHKPAEHKEPLPVEAVAKEQLDKLGSPNLQTALMAANESDIPAHVITITSTKNVGVAAFESYGDLWIITDKDEFYLKPQISGPNPELFPEFKEGQLGEGAKAYATKVPDGAEARGQGGGLLWRVVVSSDVDKKHPVEPIREFLRMDEVRGGTIIWPLKEPGKILDFKDPVSGTTLKVITTGTSKDFSGPVRKFVDFETFRTHIGLVIRPKVDDLQIKIIEEGVEISRPGGLALMPEHRLAQARNRKIHSGGPDGEQKKPAPRIFSLAEWQMGGAEVLNQNENIILSEIGTLPEGEKVENLLTLARMYLANGRGAEALGFAKFAHIELPELESNPDFLALRGAAHVIAWNSEAAFRDLSIDSLKPFEEVNYWRAYALADLSDWQQAYQVMPSDLDALYEYPVGIRGRLALVLAEVALRAGNIDMGEDLLTMAEEDKEHLAPPFQASLQYLKGEAARQAGLIDETKKLWEPLTKGEDDLYRAKAGLALTRLLMEEEDLSHDKAIDNLERLRYAWRGDQLEAAISYWLGRTYFDGGDYVKGLNVMREATAFSAGTRLGRRITEEMTHAFTDLYIGPKLNDVSPLDAVALYEQFSELTPTGDTGDKVVEMLAERLVQADLLDRAGDMLEHQVEHRLEGDEAARVAVRLAAIRLLGREPDKAVVALDKTSALLRALPEDIATPPRFHEVSLLRARAYSQNKKPDQALAILNDMELTPDVNRLRADIAWKAGYWDDAAEALGDVILDRDISLTRPLKEEDTTFILHRAIALNLASDRISLANMREKYAEAMTQTDKTRLFEVVTRPRQNAALADRDTLLNIVSEVDMFEGFLNSYRGTQAPVN